MSEQNKALAREVVEEVWNKGNYSVVDTHITSDFVGHSSLQEIHGPEGYKRFFAAFRQAFPDMHFTVEEVIAEGDSVAMRWTVQGTHEGDFQGIPPTGKQVSSTGITMGRIANSKVIEGWTNWDALGLLIKLGAVPEVEQAS